MSVSKAFIAWLAVATVALVLITISFFVMHSLPIAEFQASSLFDVKSLLYKRIFNTSILALFLVPSFLLGIAIIREQKNYVAAAIGVLGGMMFAWLVMVICQPPFFAFYAFKYTLKSGFRFQKTCDVYEKYIHPVRVGEYKILFFSANCLGQKVGIKVKGEEFNSVDIGESYELKGVESKYGVYIERYWRADKKDGEGF